MVTRATEWSYFAFPEVYTGNGNKIDRKYIVAKFLWGGGGWGGGGAQRNLLLCSWDSFVAFIALGFHNLVFWARPLTAVSQIWALNMKYKPFAPKVEAPQGAYLIGGCCVGLGFTAGA